MFWLGTDSECVEQSVNLALNSLTHFNYSTADYYAKVHNVLPTNTYSSSFHTVFLSYPLPTTNNNMTAVVSEVFSHTADSEGKAALASACGGGFARALTVVNVTLHLR
jgi:hypothetical protein